MLTGQLQCQFADFCSLLGGAAWTEGFKSDACRLIHLSFFAVNSISFRAPPATAATPSIYVQDRPL